MEIHNGKGNEEIRRKVGEVKKLVNGKFMIDGLRK
jgi:hypothetical protein